MLRIFRKKGVMKKLLWFIAIVIIISFGFFGTAYLFDGSSGRPTFAGKIYNQKISYDQYNKVFRHTNIQAFMQFGQNYFKVKEFLNLEGQTWDRLILLHEAGERNIEVSNQELISAIENIAIFQRDGQFDTLIYNDRLRYTFQTQPRDFEEGMRDSLKIDKLRELITARVEISDDEVFDAYKKQNEKVQVSYILFSPEQYAQQVRAEESQLRDYYELSKAEFLMPPSTNVEYVLIKYPEGIKEEEKANVALEADEIYDEMTENSNFDKTAEKYNLDVKTSGFFSREHPNLEIGWTFTVIQIALELREDEISRPVETDQGFYILKIKEKRKAYIPSFEEASEKIKTAFTLNESRQLAVQQAETQLPVIKEKLAVSQESFGEIAKSMGLSIEQTPVFNRGQYLPTVGLSKEFQETAFTLNEENKISRVIEVEKGYCILYLDSYVPADQENFDKSKEQLAQGLLNQKRNESFNDFLTRARLKANLVDNVSNRTQS